MDNPKPHPFSRRALIATLAAALVAAPVLVTAITPAPMLTVAVRDTIRGGTENIAFGGTITIAAKLIDDVQFRSPLALQLVIDFSNVTGTGVTSGKKYATAAQVVLHRPLLATDPIQASFPYYPDNNMLAARTALASFSVSFRAPTGLSVTSKLTTP